MNPKYPIYIISKGRWETRLTSKALESREIPYKIVVEPQEYKNYATVIDRKKILTLPFSNLGQGSIPARNWVWEHAIKRGEGRHWILDDNIRRFCRLNQNMYYKTQTGTIFKAAEDFTDRYKNIALSGMQYRLLISRRESYKPFILNTRIYSCILIKNDIPYRWRGLYNEDTDLSIRVMKNGWCTVLFNAFLADKAPTESMSGGNTDELYKDDGRLKMAQSLQEQHPSITKVVWKFQRWHHSVDYSGFKKNRLIKRDDIEISEGVNNYGMKLVHLK